MRSQSIRCRSRCLDNNQLIDVLLLFFAQPRIDMNMIDDAYQDALKTKAPLPDAVVLLSYGEVSQQLQQVWDAHAARAKGLLARGRTDNAVYIKELSIIRFFDGEFQTIFRDPSSKASYRLDILAILQRGFAEQVTTRGAFIEAPPRHIFLHPSKRRSKQFFVASELLRNEIDAYFAALLICARAWKRVRDATQIHIDTMGIYAIARAIGDIAALSGGPSTRPHIANFHSHGGMHGLYRVTQEDDLVLISASTTGSMANRLVEEGVAADAVVTLLDITDRERKGVVIYARSKHPVEMPKVRPKDDDIVIELAGEYFSARGKKPRAFTLTKDHKSSSLSGFLSSFSAESVLCINRARHESSEAIDLISVKESAVVQEEAFREWLTDEIRLKTPLSVTHVVAVPGNGGRLMADLCAEIVGKQKGVPPRIVGVSDLFQLEASAVGGVLVCAPVVGNGHVLRSVARDLREVLPEVSRHFIVGIGLPETAEGWQRLNQFLTESGNPKRKFAFSAWLDLPTGMPPGTGAAWLRATKLLQGLDAVEVIQNPFWSIPDIGRSLTAAGDALEAASSNFLPNSAGNPLRLTQGFVYWNPPPAALAACDHAATSFLAMSSALQMAREHADSAARLSTSTHESVVLDPENFLRFNDGVLQASILRASLSIEIDYSSSSDLSELMREFLEKVFINHSTNYGEASLEFALSLATGHLELKPTDAKLMLERCHRYCGVGALQGLLYLYAIRSGALIAPSKD